jgi:tripartite-type tricarboxylate transporter receptor subunit TctC
MAHSIRPAGIPRRAALLLPALPAIARAQPARFPDRPVRLVVPSAPAATSTPWRGC